MHGHRRASFNGLDALEEAWDVISSHLGKFVIVNAVATMLLILGLVGTSFAVVSLSASDDVTVFALTMVVGLLASRPVWELVNTRAALALATRGSLHFADFAVGWRGVLNAYVIYVAVRIVATIGLLLLVIPGVVAYCRLGLAGALVEMQPDIGPLGGVRQSWRATAGRFTDMYALSAANAVAFPLSATPLMIALYFLAVAPFAGSGGDTSAAIMGMFSAVLVGSVLGLALAADVAFEAVATTRMALQLTSVDR